MSDSEEGVEGFQIGNVTYIQDGDVFRRLSVSYSTPPPYITTPITTSGAPPANTPHSTTTPSTSLPTDVAALQSIINTLRAELNATTSANANLAATVARLQAELTATTSANTNLAASVARLQAEQTIPTPTTTPIPAATDHATTPPTTAPLPCSHPEHPRTIASGRGAASPEVFQEIIKTNWHGRLGRTHMVDVDALSPTALTELDCLLRRNLHALYPPGKDNTSLNTDPIFASLAVLGLRLEDRSAYVDRPVIHEDSAKRKAPTVKRGRSSVAWYITQERYGNYWEGVMFETLLELAEYRGLFDDQGYLKEK